MSSERMVVGGGWTYRPYRHDTLPSFPGRGAVVEFASAHHTRLKVSILTVAPPGRGGS